ncbi:MAG: restriction endonuclease subunit S [Bacteroidia bacterium]|nr:restriction endonuclease subunit S [Bacteroidia bacterium]
MKWKEYSLDELIHIKHGYAFKGEFFSEEPTDDILLTPGNFAIGGGFKAQKLKYYNGDFPVDYILDENDVIVTMTDLSKEADTLGFSAKVPAWNGKRFLHNQRIGLVKLKTDDFDQNYLYWLMRTFSYQRFVANGATGATVKHTSPTKICQYKFTAPENKDRQRKVASILSAYDDLIENNLKRIKLLEEKAFLRYKQIVREEKLEKYILSDFGDIITGKTPSTTIADYFGDDVPFIKTPDMHNQIFIEHTDQMLSELGAKSQEKKFLPPLSLCVSCIGTAGVVGITSKPSQTNQQINSIVFNEPKNVYFFYALMSQMKEQLDALGSNGSTFTNVNKNKFENMEVFIPNQKVLNEFAEEFEPPFSLILTLQKQNTKLREARDILLPKLMNGQIEV